LARKTGISPAQISQIEGGVRKSPGFSSIVKIAAALSLSLDEVAVAAGLREGPAPVPSFPLGEIRRIKAEAGRVAARAEAILNAFDSASQKSQN
jgi:transcriptional regulator with XRE-family HTH domain